MIIYVIIAHVYNYIVEQAATIHICHHTIYSPYRLSIDTIWYTIEQTSTIHLPSHNMILLTIYSLYHMVYHRTSIYHTDGTITQWFYSPYTLYTIWYTIEQSSTIQMYHHTMILLTIYSLYHMVYHKTRIYHTDVPRAINLLAIYLHR